MGIRLLEAPTDRVDDPRAQVYIIDHVEPGSSFSRRIEVLNSTTDDLPIELYPGAAEIRESAWSPLEGRAHNELVDWITVEPATVHVPAGERAEAVVTVDVDAAASEGERYAVVWAQPPSADVGGTTVVNRVGIRVYLSVGEGGEPASDFQIESLRAQRSAAGEPVVEATVRNTGGRAIDVAGELTLSDGPGGVSAGPFDVRSGTTIGIGEQAPVLAVLDPALPAGPWEAEMVLRSGQLERSARAALTFPDAPGESAEGAISVGTDEGDGGAVEVWLALLALLLLLLMVLAIFVVLRKGRRERDEDEAEEPLQTAGV